MSMNAGFTIRSDEFGTVVSYDEGHHVTLDDASAAELRQLVLSASGTPATFSAATLASFAEARRCAPSPVDCGPLLDLALASQSQPIGDVVRLKDDGPRSTSPLLDVLDRRRSGSKFDNLSLADLSALLVRSARVRDWSYDARGQELSTRPSPSAGAIHPLKIEVLAARVGGLDPGTWLFDPFLCQLVRTNRNEDETTRALAAIAEAAPTAQFPAALVVIANSARTLSRYPSGTAHVWRDAGCLLTILHLVATDIGLSSRILGTSGMTEQFGERGLDQVDVGALILG